MITQNGTFNGFTLIASISRKFQSKNVLSQSEKELTCTIANYKFLHKILLYDIIIFIPLKLESQQLHNAQQIVTTLSKTLMSWRIHIIKLIGRADSKMENVCLTTPKTLSTWTWTGDN